MVSQNTSDTQALYKMIAVAIVYFLAGRFGMAFTVAEGIASPVWPASGVALAAALLWGRPALWGVFVAQVAVALTVIMPIEEVLASPGQTIWFLILSAGPALQATFASYLIKRYVTFPNSFENSRDIYAFMTFGGPLGCLVSSTLSVGLLFVTGSLPLEAVFNQWFTWWMGDTIGSILAATMIILCIAPQDLVSKQRKKIVLVPLSVLFVVISVAFFLVKNEQEAAFYKNFQKDATVKSYIIQDNVLNLVKGIESLETLYTTSDRVSVRQFGVFASHILEHFPSIQSLYWSPKVLDADRIDFEKKRQDDNGDYIMITEMSADNGRIAAETRDEYYPVYFAETTEEGRESYGYDIASTPAGKEAVQRSLQKRTAVMSRALQCADHQGDHVLLVSPIFQSDASGKEQHAGFISTVLSVSHLFEDLLGEDMIKMMGVKIEIGEGDTRTLLYESGLGGDVLLTEKREIQMRDDLWTIHFTAKNGYLDEGKLWPTWLTMIGVLLFLSLLQFLLLIVTGQTSAIERVVTDRTKELKRSNAELERFAYIASHDLKSPLRHVSICAEFMMEEHGDVSKEESEEYLRIMKTSVKRMMMMVDSLLEYSRIGNEDISLDETVDFNEVVEEIKTDLSAHIKETGAMITNDYLPTTSGNKNLLSRLLLNLMQNGIKYCDKDTVPKIHVSAVEDDQGYIFAVEDNGIGIPKRFAKKIFVVFQRLHREEEYSGTGIGLPTCKRIIEYHGGRIWLNEKPRRKGSRFCFYLPIKNRD